MEEIAQADRVHPEADEHGRVGARAHATEPGDVDHILLRQASQGRDRVVDEGEVGAPWNSGHSRPRAPAPSSISRWKREEQTCRQAAVCRRWDWWQATGAWDGPARKAVGELLVLRSDLQESVFSVV